VDVLRVLADGEFHSGTAIAQCLGVSRGTVWNFVRTLEGAGLDVYHVKGRGYRLAQPASMLQPEAIGLYAGDARGRFAIEVVDVVASTNTLLMQRAAAGAPGGTVLVAEWQRAGRGRMHRPWHAGPGAALTFSVLWRFREGAAALAGLSLSVGVALARALAKVGAENVLLKWPNDVIWREQKLAGVLIEMHGDALGPSAVVIGIGVNVRLSAPMRERIDQPATDLETVCGHAVDRNAVFGTILHELAAVLDVFATGGFAPLRAEWERHNAHQGRRVSIVQAGGGTVAGVIRGVAGDGALLFDAGRGIARLHSGEISVRASDVATLPARASRLRDRA
jgi:BirA family biotin operon repressor/biotin-[acetyl-CoA-carboxylase] ligase